MNLKSQKRLKQLRSKIDQVDQKLLRILQQRSKIVQKIAMIKVDQHLPILQKKRSQEIEKNRRRVGVSLGLSKVYIDHIFRLVMRESIKEQKIILKKSLETKLRKK